MHTLYNPFRTGIGTQLGMSAKVKKY